MIQIIIYAGAILVLFFFVIALLTIGNQANRTRSRQVELSGGAVDRGWDRRALRFCSPAFAARKSERIQRRRATSDSSRHSAPRS